MKNNPFVFISIIQPCICTQTHSQGTYARRADVPVFSLSTVHRASSAGLRTPCRASWTGGRPSGPPCASEPCQPCPSATRVRRATQPVPPGGCVRVYICACNDLTGRPKAERICVCMCVCICMRVVAASARLLVGERGVAHKQLEELRGARGLRPPRLRCRCSAYAMHMQCACGAHAVHMRCACSAHAVRMRCACGVHAVCTQCACSVHAEGTPQGYACPQAWRTCPSPLSPSDAICFRMVCSTWGWPGQGLG